MRRRKTLLTATCCTALLIVAVGVMLLWKPPAPKPPMLTANPAEIEYPEPPLVDRIPRTWGWAWRIRDKLLPRDTIRLTSRLVELDGVELDLLDDLPPVTLGSWESNGFALWILTEEQQEWSAQQLSSPTVNVLQQPTVTTGDRMQAHVSISHQVALTKGAGPAGLDLGFYPRILSTGTDLMLTLTVTETLTNRIPDIQRSQDGMAVASLHTNMAVGARLSIPRQGGLFLLKRTPDDSGETSLGLFISVDVPCHKR